MDHGGEAARQTTAGSTELGMAGAVQGSVANIASGTFDGQLGAAAAPPGSFSDFDLHHEPGPGVAYPNNGASWRQLGPIGVVLVVFAPHLPDGVVRVHDNDGYYSLLQPRPGPGARRGVMLVELLLEGGAVAVHNGDYTLQARPGAQHGEVLVDLLPDGADAGHDQAFVVLLPTDGVASFDDYVYYSLQLRPAAGHGEVLTVLLPNGNGAEHGEVFPSASGGGAVHDHYSYYVWQPRLGAGGGVVLVNLLPSGGVEVHDDYGYYVWQPRLGAGGGVVLVNLLPSGGVEVHDDYGYYVWQPRLDAEHCEVLPDGVGVVFDGSGNFAWQTLSARATMATDGIAGALRGPDHGQGYDNRGVVAEHLRRLLPFAGIGALSVAMNGLAAGPGSPAAAFHLFVLLLGGLFLVILHVLRV